MSDEGFNKAYFKGLLTDFDETWKKKMLEDVKVPRRNDRYRPYAGPWDLRDFYDGVEYYDPFDETEMMHSKLYYWGPKEEANAYYNEKSLWERYYHDIQRYKRELAGEAPPTLKFNGKTEGFDKNIQANNKLNDGFNKYMETVEAQKPQFSKGAKRTPYFGIAALGAIPTAVEAANFAYQNPTPATISTGVGLTGTALGQLAHTGMDTAMAYDAASQMYQDFANSEYGRSAGEYLSGLRDLIAQRRLEEGID